MMRLLNILLLSLLCSLASKAQGIQDILKKDKKEFLYRHELSAGLRVHTNSVTVFLEKVWIESIYNRNVIQAEYSYFFDPRQKRQDGTTIGNRQYKNYVYGKVNNFFCFRFNYGQRRTLAEKAKKSGVALYLMYMGGVSLGIEKPYYLELRDPDDPTLTMPEKYSADNADRFLDNNPSTGKIAGYAGVQYGWKDLKPVPGGHAKIGLNFDWGKHDQFIKALEVGVAADIYYKRVNILVTKTNNPYFLSAYASIQLGKRW